MDSINFAFIVPGDEYNDDCHQCAELWEESEKRPEDLRRIRSAHNNCHGWTHCEIDCCGPCPYCGWCEGIEEYYDNPIRFDKVLNRVVEMTDEELEEAKKYVPADLEDVDNTDWSRDEAFEKSR